MPPKEADPPELPAYLARVWMIFSDLHAQRGRGMAPEPITYDDIETRARVMRDPVAPWEAMAIRKLDDAYLLTAAEASQNNIPPTRGAAGQ